MLQLDPAFSEKAYGSSTFTDFVEKLNKAGYIDISGSEGRYVISRKSEAKPEEPAHKPEQALPVLRDVLETHRLEMDNGCSAEDLESWVHAENPDFEPRDFGFQEFTEVLNFAQDKLLVRVEPDEERGLVVYLGAEFYPPAPPEPTPEELAALQVEEEERQPESNQTPALMEPPPKKKRARKAAGEGGTRRRTRASGAAGTSGTRTPRRTPRKKAPTPDSM
jgi:hypothetical protein